MKKKINVLFDATVLANNFNKDGSRTGIFFVACNILIELLKRPELKVNLYCDTKQLYGLIGLIDSDKRFKNTEIFKYSKLECSVAYFEWLKYKNKVNKESKIVRVVIKAILNFLKSISEQRRKLNINFGFISNIKKFDVFISAYEKIPESIAKIPHIKKYTILYDTIPIIYPENYPGMDDGTFWHHKLTESINKDDFYFSISDYTKNDFIKYVKNINPDHIKTIPLSTGIFYSRVEDNEQIDAVKEKYNIPKNKKYLFCLCTLEPRKNQIFAIKNFIEFIKKNNIDDFIFVLGGTSWPQFEQKINDAINDLDNYKDKIVRVGYIDDNDMPALYSGAEMFVFPSIYEGFGIPILEAMKCGCPVISSNVASMPEVIGDCGIQINPTSDEELIMAFEKMYYQRDFREECINKGLEREKLFTWEKCADIIVKEIIKNG